MSRRNYTAAAPEPQMPEGSGWCHHCGRERPCWCQWHRASPAGEDVRRQWIAYAALAWFLAWFLAYVWLNVFLQV